MDDENLDDLIAEYLSNRMPKAERIVFEQRMVANPMFAKSVAETGKAHQFLEHIHYQELRQKLVAYDQRMDRDRLVRKKWLITLTFILVCSFFCFLWIHSHWSATAIALTYASGVRIQSDQRHQLTTDDLYWQIALDTYSKKDFKNAWQQFIPFTAQPENPHYFEAQWNILLCRLVLEGATSEWKEDFNLFLRTHHGIDKSLDAKKKINSWQYRVASLPCWTTFSTINPQII